jgi:hypothetical protein
MSSDQLLTRDPGETEPRSACDCCHGDTGGEHLEGRLTANRWREWLTYCGVKKSAESGLCVFRFCAACVFEKPHAKPDKERFWELMKERMGIIDYDAYCTAERQRLFGAKPAFVNKHKQNQ